MQNVKLDFVKLTPQEVQAIDNVLGEIPTKFGLPIVSILQNATNRRLAELEALAMQEAEGKEAEQPDFMTPETKI